MYYCKQQRSFPLFFSLVVNLATFWSLVMLTFDICTFLPSFCWWSVLHFTFSAYKVILNLYFLIEVVASLCYTKNTEESIEFILLPGRWLVQDCNVLFSLHFIVASSFRCKLFRLETLVNWLMECHLCYPFRLSKYQWY